MDLTTAEAAFIADIPPRDIRRVFEEHILPEPLIRNAPRVSYLGAACASFYFKTENIYAASFRRRVLDTLISRFHVAKLHNLAALYELQAEPPAGSWSVDLKGPVGDQMHVDLAFYVKAVATRRNAVEKIKGLITSDPEIMGGLPVFTGTRVPVEIIAGSLEKGINREAILHDYPDLTAEQLDAAKVYFAVNPPRGRPRKAPPASWKPIKTTRVAGPTTGT